MLWYSTIPTGQRNYTLGFLLETTKQ